MIQFIHYQLCFFVIVFIGTFVRETNQANIFCSAYCTPKSCTTTLSTGCTGCSFPFLLTGGLCQIDPNSGFAVIGQSQNNQFGAGITMSINTSLTTQTCTSSATFQGKLTDQSRILITASPGTTLPHFNIHLVFFAVMTDTWSSNARITIKLLNTGQVQSRKRDNSDQQQKLCATSNKEDYKFRIENTFAHSQINDTISIEFQIYITKDWTGTLFSSGSSNGDWGVKQFILLAELCHPACTACWNNSVTKCTACQESTPMYLSGTTCNQSCLTGYGYTDYSNTCVLCDKRCQICYNISDNCTVCTPSGTWQSYLVQVNFSCVAVCPAGYYGNQTIHVCQPCNTQCATCKFNSSYCLSCNVTMGYGWNSFTCYNPCPDGTYSNLGGANCSNCNAKCITCENSSTLCFNCTLSGVNQAYYFNQTIPPSTSLPLSTCLSNCPVQYYKQNYNLTGPNVCLPCDISCYQCTSSPIPCTICNPNFYLYQAACGTTCPADYFTDQVTWACLLCQTNCTILTMSVRFPNALKQQLWIDMNFTEVLDFSNFSKETFQTITFDDSLVTLEMFDVSYEITSDKSYKIILKPKGYTFLYNVTVTITTMSMPSPKHQAANGRPFRPDNYQKSESQNWFLIVAPDASQIQQDIITSFSGFSDTISNITTQPWIQQIKKTGIFSFLAGGAQITSCAILINNIPSQNFYQGVRIWASFIFFDVPAWQQGSFKVKHVFSPTVNNLTQNARLLFNLDNIDFRFYRTGHTTFFIFDVYLQILLLVVCWIVLIIFICLQKHYYPKIKLHIGKVYSFMHKLHEISIMYIGISTLLQWIYFDAASAQRWASLAICLVANLYFLAYELFIYYDMIKYPAAKIGDQKYEIYVIRYGSLLKNIRFEQYDIREPWSPKQWFRPYNYHILSFYKKLLMMACLPLFYDMAHAQISVLIFIQLLEVLRFIFTWPFISKWRNIVRLLLELVLMGFFITVLAQGIYVQQIMLNDQATIQNAVTMFYRWGWAGFALCFTFNISFIIILIIDLVLGCKSTNREMMDEARRIYYFDKLKTYQVQNQDVPLGLVNKWVKLGNLNKRDYDDLPDINLRVEYFRIFKSPNGRSYQIQMRKLLELYMNVQFNFQKENNITIGRKINKKFNLTPQISPQFYYLIDKLYQKYDSNGVQYICLKTFQVVQQNKFKPGDKIELIPQEMNQTVQVESYTSQKKTHRLSKRLDGFPINLNDLKAIQSIN